MTKLLSAFMYLFVSAVCHAGDVLPVLGPKTEVGRLLRLNENEIDVGIAALTMAKEIYPKLDIAEYSRKIDAIVDKVSRLAAGTLDPERRIRALNTVFFLREGFRYDHSPFARSKQDYYFLNGILDTKLGICYTMPLLYLAIAQRLGYPIYPVAAPDHLFLRYVVPGFAAANIEATSGGKYFSDADYIEDFSITRRSIERGSYLRAMTFREFLGYMLSANALAYGKRGEGGRTIQYLERATELNPKFADHYQVLAEAYIAKGEMVGGESKARYQARAGQLSAKAAEFGFIGQEAVSLGQKLRGR